MNGPTWRAKTCTSHSQHCPEPHRCQPWLGGSRAGSATLIFLCQVSQSQSWPFLHIEIMGFDQPCRSLTRKDILKLGDCLHGSKKERCEPKGSARNVRRCERACLEVQAKPTHFKTSDKEAVQGAQTCVGGHEVICRMSARQDSSPI